MLPNFFYGDGSLGMQLLQFAGQKIQRYKTGNSLNLQNVHHYFLVFSRFFLVLRTIALAAFASEGEKGQGSRSLCLRKS